MTRRTVLIVMVAVAVLASGLVGVTDSSFMGKSGALLAETGTIKGWVNR